MAHIGLLEDNVHIAQMCATLLHTAGHQVVIYEHPRKCLQALLPRTTSDESLSLLPDSLKSSVLPVEVLILDLTLPDMDGVEVLRFLSSHPDTQALPLIVCTAATRAEVARALRVAPHAFVVEKPFRVQTLIAAIATALNTPST